MMRTVAGRLKNLRGAARILAFAAATLVPAQSQAEPAIPPGIAIEADTIAVSSNGDVPDASVGYIAYTAADDANRPVLFAFNGGPGASSTFLHLGVLGPARLEVPQDPTAHLPARAPVAANTGNLLDIADIVFLDPPGTGFSSREGADAEVYNSVSGDARAVAQAVDAWLAANGRSDAPVYILGESYGTIRAVAMLDAFAALESAPSIRGVVLLGQALNMIETSQRPDNIISYVVSLPSLAAIACYHGKASQPCTPQAIADEAARFAHEEYLPALFAGETLPDAERHRIAARLEALSGISAAFYLAHDLRISKERFRVELLRDAGKVIGRYDARYLAPRPEDAGPVVGPDAFSAVSDLYAAAMPGYLGTILPHLDAGTYKVIARPEGTWRYGGADSPFADWPFMEIVEQAARSNACLRLFVGTGIFDLTTTIGAADYLFAQTSLPPARYRAEEYGAGHMFYSDAAAREAFLEDMRSFIAADGCP
ncbi:septum formation initiator [Pelagerythrobacter marensis]|uniref:Septum formation initiator n=1 Tax=Pelagerythrobacter marensis TaxID=543877 RepID=A0ABZ2D5K6_9SPHN